jgi:hypothetical protein
MRQCHPRIRTVAVFLLVLTACHSFILAQNGSRRPVNRARLPVFDDPTAGGIFYKNAFTEGLVGRRPANMGQVVRVPGNVPPAVVDVPAEPPGAGGYAWSRIISAEVIEDEIKRIKLEVDQNVTTPGKFAGRGYKSARRHFSVLAMLFAIIAEYDGDVRWKEDSLLARDLFARTAANAKVGTIQVFNESKQRKDQLQELISGSRLPGNPGELPTDWSRVCNRPPLMQRLEIAQQQKLMPGTASKAVFSTNLDQLLHEAEVMAAIAEVLTREGMEDGDDETYAEFCHRMRDGARKIVEAIRSDNHEQARQAVGDIGKSCSECHEGYRA